MKFQCYNILVLHTYHNIYSAIAINTVVAIFLINARKFMIQL
jgi:hypothetical protein